ncbi:MAG: glycosyl transferase family 2 [Actinomycetota bacterium]
MAGSTILHKSVVREIEKMGRADILVGIPSFRDKDTISHVIKTASEGMARFFPGLMPVLVNSCGGVGEACETREVALRTPVPPNVKKIITHYRGPAGKGSAFRTIFEIADRLRVRVCITVDADLQSITPRWIKLLGEPVFKYNYGLVTPFYHRHKHDGTITNNVAYPLTRALYGFRVRQPIGGEFGFSGALAKILSHQPVWETDIARFGVDVWMTTTAITEGFRVAQASMGVKLHDPKDPATDLSSMFKQVVGTLFKLMGEHEVKWKAVRESMPVDTLGGSARRRELREKEVSPFKLIEHFKAGFRSHKAFFKRYLERENFQQISRIATLSEEAFHFPEELWVKIVYDFAAAYNFSGENPELVVGTLTPLFYGRTAAFMIESQGMSPVMVESLVEGQARVFEELKPYLIRRWNAAKERKP